MIVLRKDNPYKGAITLATICLLIISYFIFQLFIGKYNILSTNKKKTELQGLINEYEFNKADLILYEQKIKALDHKNIDEDVLEGEMKKQLYYTKPNEIMIILPSKK